jgi:hypothetical protein
MLVERQVDTKFGDLQNLVDFLILTYLSIDEWLFGVLKEIYRRFQGCPTVAVVRLVM